MSTDHQRRRQRRTRQEKLVLILCIVLFLGAGIYGLIRAFIRPPEVEQTPPDSSQQQDGGESDSQQNPDQVVFTRKKDYFTVLLSGIDDDNGGSDTNILVSIDSANGEINAVSLPRDTLINTDWNVPKLNAAYKVGGVERLQEEAGRLLGIPVDFYVSIDLQGFVDLVNHLGGIYFDVPINMDYDDPTQDLHIHFDKGYQYLDGEDALKVVRFRQNNDGTGYPGADIDRIQTQQSFLTAMAKEMLSKVSLSSLQAYADMFAKYVDTDLTIGNLVWIGEQVLKMGMENVHFHTLPGDGSGYYKGASYYILYPEEVLELVNSALNPYEQDLTLDNMDILVP